MRLAVKGNKRTYFAQYTGTHQNRGIGLWTYSKGKQETGLGYIAYLCPDENGNDTLVVDIAQIKKQKLKLIIKGKEEE